MATAIAISFAADGPFTQEDPIGIAGGLNLYGYAGSDPINNSDPFGLCVFGLPCPQWFVNAVAGFGDGASRGWTAFIRQHTPGGDDVDYNSVTYAVTAAIGTAAIDYLTDGAGEADAAEPKPGSAGGPNAGKRFSRSVQDAARAESGDRCVFCQQGTVQSDRPAPNRSNIDHSIPRSRGGNNSPANAQNTCQTCNLRKAAQTTEEYLKSHGGGE